MTTADESSQSTGRTSGDGTTCGPSRQSQSTTGALTFSAEDSLVRTSPTRENGSASAVSGAVCGRSSPAPFAVYAPDSSSWRTSRRCFVGGWGRFSATWPRSGLMRNGKCYQRKPLVRLIRVAGRFLLPTPVASLSGVASCFNEAMVFRVTRFGVPRKISNSGVSGNAGLTRLVLLATGMYPLPTFGEWMMGFPKGWSGGMESETPSSPKSPNGSDGKS